MSGKKTDLTTKGRKSENVAEEVKSTAGSIKKSAKKPAKSQAAKTASDKAAAVKPAAKSAKGANAESKAAKPENSSAKTAKPAAKSAEKKASADKAVKKSTADTAAVKESKTSVEKTSGKSTAAKAGKSASAKTESKPSAAKKDGKSTAKKDSKTTEISSKTPQVMKLVEQKIDVVNPTIVAGKSGIPSKLRGMEPLSRIMKREAENIFGSDVTETYNLVSLVTADHAAETLRRFNACDCEVCVETLSRLVEDDIPARFAKLRKGDVERNSSEVKRLKEPLQKPVTTLMIRLVMQNKKRSYHE